MDITKVAAISPIIKVNGFESKAFKKYDKNKASKRDNKSKDFQKDDSSKEEKVGKDFKKTIKLKQWEAVLQKIENLKES